MKLYTEENLRKAFEDGYTFHASVGQTTKEHFEKGFRLTVYSLTPIELPSDEQIYEKYSAFISTEVTLGFLTKEQGERLKWYYKTYLINEIQGGNK